MMDTVLNAQYGLYLATQRFDAASQVVQSSVAADQGPLPANQGAGPAWMERAIAARAAAQRQAAAQIEVSRLSDRMLGELLKLQDLTKTL